MSASDTDVYEVRRRHEPRTENELAVRVGDRVRLTGERHVDPQSGEWVGARLLPPAGADSAWAESAADSGWIPAAVFNDSPVLPPPPALNKVPRRSRTVHPAETEAVPAVQPRGAKPPPASATGSATNALAPIQLPTRFDAVQMEAYFRRLDLDRNGQLSRSEFRRLAENVQTHATDAELLRKVDALFRAVDEDNSNTVDLSEFTKHFNDIHVLHRLAAATLPPKQGRYYVDMWHDPYWPWFILICTIVQISVFIGYAVDRGDVDEDGPPTWDTPLAFRPSRKEEVWRWFSYALVHAGWLHLFVNMIIQLIFGIPLELAHSWWRIGVVYIIGAFAGSGASSIFDPDTNLVGASGADYALIAVWFADLTMNWKEMPYRWMRLIFLILVVGFDWSYTIARMVELDDVSTTSVAAHAGGFIAGFLAGIVFLQNFYVRNWERVLRGVGIALSAGLLLLVIIYNIVVETD